MRRWLCWNDHKGPIEGDPGSVLRRTNPRESSLSFRAGDVRGQSFTFLVKRDRFTAGRLEQNRHAVAHRYPPAEIGVGIGEDVLCQSVAVGTQRSPDDHG